MAHIDLTQSSPKVKQCEEDDDDNVIDLVTPKVDPHIKVIDLLTTRVDTHMKVIDLVTP